MSIEVLKGHLMAFTFTVTGFVLVGITWMLPCEALGGAFVYRICECGGWAFLTGAFLDAVVNVVANWWEERE